MAMRGVLAVPRYEMETWIVAIKRTARSAAAWTQILFKAIITREIKAMNECRTIISGAIVDAMVPEQHTWSDRMSKYFHVTCQNGGQQTVANTAMPPLYIAH